MIVKDNRAETPHGNSIIWKYYGLDKFLDLLFNESLFFTNANKMTDKYEGLIPKRNEKHILKSVEKDNKEQFNQKHFIDLINALKKLTLINCWTINRDESYALWKIYLGGAKAGVAIRSTVSKLENAIRLGKDSFDEDIYISKVKYTGFIEKDPLNRFNVITTKNRFYEYEREMRLFIFNYAPSEGGYETPYDIGIGR